MSRNRLRAPAAVAAILACFGAQAADPASGTLSPDSTELTYTVPPAPLLNLSGLTNLSGDYTCDATNPCDEYELTIDLPEGFMAENRKTKVSVAAATSVEYFDIDLQISDDKGNVAYIQRDNPPAQPTITFVPKDGVVKYTVQVAPGSPHAGAGVTIKLLTKKAGEGDADSAAGGAFGLGGLLALLGLALPGLRRRAGL